MTSTSLVLLVFFLILFAVGMRMAERAQKRAQQKPRQPLPPPLKNFPSDSCSPMRGLSGLGTLVVTGYVASSTIRKMQSSDSPEQ